MNWFHMAHSNDEELREIFQLQTGVRILCDYSASGPDAYFDTFLEKVLINF